LYPSGKAPRRRAADSRLLAGPDEALPARCSGSAADTLPRGLKAVTRPACLSARGQPTPFLKPGFALPYLLEGQRISFCTRLTYYARSSGKGEFIGEPATMQRMRVPGLIAVSDALRITVD
jgi:hypothetical protein